MMSWEVQGRKQKLNNDHKHHPPASTTMVSNKKWVASRPGDSERRYLADYSPPKEEDDYYNMGMSSAVQTNEPLQPASMMVWASEVDDDQICFLRSLWWNHETT